MPSLVDHGDGALSIASSVSKHSEILPERLEFNNSGDSTDASTNPSVNADGNLAEQDEVAASGSKQQQQQKKKKSMLSKLNTPFRGVRSSASRAKQKKKAQELPPQAPHTLYLSDDKGNVECYVLDAHAVFVEEQEKAKGLPPVGLVSDGAGNVECRALDERSLRTEKMMPPVEEDQQLCNMSTLLTKGVCLSPSSDATMMDNCYEETVKCSFYDQIYSQLMSLPKNECSTTYNLSESACVDQENLNLPDSISKEVKGGLQFLDGTLDCIVGGLFPPREDINSIQELGIEHSDTQAEI